MGVLECDDGNAKNGDGCNSKCEVEDGYRCYRNEGHPDSCVSSVSPEASLKVQPGCILSIEFSESVKSLIDSISSPISSNDVLTSIIGNKLIQSFDISIYGIQTNCSVSWNLYSSLYKPDHDFRKLLIQVKPTCSLSGSEIYYISLNKSLILNGDNNELVNSKLSAPALKYSYISDSQKNIAGVTGTAFNLASFLTFGLTLGMSLLQSTAVGSFWVFVNMLQVLFYISAINCELPYALEVFLTRYMMVSKVCFPFSMMPSWFPNPENYLTMFVTEEFNTRFSFIGYSTWSFIYNFSSQLATWSALAFFYAILWILSKLFPEPLYSLLSSSSLNNRCGFIHRWKRDYEYNAIIRIVIECYLDLFFCALLDLSMVHFSLSLQYA